MQDGKSISDVIADLCDQKKPYDMVLNNILLKNCYISQMEAERVSQTIIAMGDPNFREIIPVTRYIHGTINVCDGHFSHVLKFQATDITLEKTLAEIEEIKEKMGTEYGR